MEITQFTIEGVYSDGLVGPHWGHVNGSECHNAQTARQVLKRIQQNDPERRFRIKVVDSTGTRYFYGL